MKTWATGVDSLGCTRQITVGDVWENMRDDRLHVEIISYNGQWFEAETIDCCTGYRQKCRISDFNEFVNNWQIFSYGVHYNVEVPIEPLRVISTTITIPEAPRCTCGACKIGVKDYSRGHSSWCDVYKA